MCGPAGRLEELQLAARNAAERERAADQGAFTHIQRHLCCEARVPRICKPASAVSRWQGSRRTSARLLFHDHPSPLLWSEARGCSGLGFQGFRDRGS